MRHFSKFGALLAVAIFSTAQMSAQTRVQHVVVRGSGAATEVEIQTSGAAVAPNTQTITGPDRIIVDLPGALPAADLHALELKVQSGALKSVRAGLFFNNPPITRVVLDLASPQSYHIATAQNSIVVKLGPATDAAKQDLAKQDSAKQASAKLGSEKSASDETNSAAAFGPDSPNVKIVRTPRLHNTLLSSAKKPAPLPVSAPVAAPVAPAPVEAAPVDPVPPSPPVTVTFLNGMLSIHAEKATLAQVLYEVQVQTQAEIPIPSGAEQEQVISDIGPAPAREVLSSLLNGSPYNFIFVGNEQTLERVILTRRDPNNF